MDTLPFPPSPQLAFQFIVSTYCSDEFYEIEINHKHAKHGIIIPHLRQLGWQTLPPLIITPCVCGAIHHSSMNKLCDLGIPQIKISLSWKLSHLMPLTTYDFP